MEAVGARAMTLDELEQLLGVARMLGTHEGYKAAFGFAGRCG